MKLTSQIVVILLLMITMKMSSQNVGIGTTTPGEKLDVNGKVRANGVIINTGGSPYDFLMKNNATGEVGFKKAHGGLGLNYIICIQGSFPIAGGPPLTTPFLGQIKLFAGSFAPAGWLFCQGQLLSIPQFTSLFGIIGSYYGGDGVNSFALPDLRGAAAIGTGIAAPAGYQWALGEKTN